jgi:hypothetical protein
MSNKSYSNDDLIDAVDRIRLLRGEEPLSYRGMEKKYYMVFVNAERKKLYYKIQDIMKFLDDVDALDDLYFDDRIS